MNRIKNSLIAFGGLSLLFGAIAFATPRATQGHDDDTVGPTKPVKVVNTPSEPVPVTGTVNVGNLGDSPLPVRDVDNGQQPFQQFVRIPAGPVSFTVPEGKRLVIEYFSGSLSSGTNCSANYVLIRTTVTVAGEEREGSHFFPPTHTQSLLGESFSQQTRIYADPNTVVRFSIETDPNNCGASLLAEISGYLVDVP